MSLGKRQGGLQVQLLHEQRLLLYQLWCALEHLRHLFSNIKEIEKWWDFCRGAEWATEQSKGDNDVDNRWTSLGPILPSWMAFVPKHGGDFTWPWWSPHGVDPIGGSANVFIVSCILVYIYIDKIKSTLAFILYRLFHTDFDVCNHQELKRKWVIKQQKT